MELTLIIALVVYTLSIVICAAESALLHEFNKDDCTIAVVIMLVPLLNTAVAVTAPFRIKRLCKERRHDTDYI